MEPRQTQWVWKNDDMPVAEPYAGIHMALTYDDYDHSKEEHMVFSKVFTRKNNSKDILAYKFEGEEDFIQIRRVAQVHEALICIRVSYRNGVS